MQEEKNKSILNDIVLYLLVGFLGLSVVGMIGYVIYSLIFE